MLHIKFDFDRSSVLGGEVVRNVTGPVYPVNSSEPSAKGIEESLNF